MKYVNQSFSAPVCGANISDLEYALRVGNITQAEFDLEVGHQPIEGLKADSPIAT